MVKAVRAFLWARRESDNPFHWFRALLGGVLFFERIAYLPALECAIWWYLIRSWGKQPFVPKGAQAFTCHKSSGCISLACVIVAVGIVETIVVHILLLRISLELATIVTVLTAYMLLWLIGEMRAVVLNPILLTTDSLIIRWGARIHEEIPLTQISAHGTTEPDVPKRECLNLVPLNATPYWIEFFTPFPTTTYTGGTRLVRAIAISPDNASSFVATLDNLLAN